MRYFYKTHGGVVSMMQAGRDDLWRLRFGDVLGTEYSTPEGALFALNNRTARLPGGLSFDDWRAPSSLSLWKSEIVMDDLPPRASSDDPDEG